MTQGILAQDIEFMAAITPSEVIYLLASHTLFSH